MRLDKMPAEHLCTVRLLRAGLMRVKEAAIASGVSEFTVRNWVRQHAIDVSTARAVYFADWWLATGRDRPDAIVAALASGEASVSDLAQATGFSTTQIRRQAKKVGVAFTARADWCSRLWELAIVQADQEITRVEQDRAKIEKEEAGRYVIYGGQTLDTWRGVWIGKPKK